MPRHRWPDSQFRKPQAISQDFKPLLRAVLAEERTLIRQGTLIARQNIVEKA
jgi:hypothetical protein